MIPKAINTRQRELSVCDITTKGRKPPTKTYKRQFYIIGLQGQCEQETHNATGNDICQKNSFICCRDRSDFTQGITGTPAKTSKKKDD